MDDPPAPDARSSEPPNHRMPVERAVFLLALFVLATIVLLGQLHPSSSAASAGGATATTTTSTTKPPPATTTTTAPKPTAAPVLVANASGKTGAAADIADQLQTAGWTVQTPMNATVDVATSAVYYVAGQKTAALDVASDLKLPASVVLPYTTAAPVSTIGTAEILVVVAPDLADNLSPTTTTTSA